MEGKELKWYKIAQRINEIEWQANNMAVIDVDGKKVTLIKSKGEIAACAHKCPHAGGIMADGFIDALGNIVCPLHKYRFSPNKGRNVSGEGYQLKTFAVLQNEEGIFVGWGKEM